MGEGKKEEEEEEGAEEEVPLLRSGCRSAELSSYFTTDDPVRWPGKINNFYMWRGMKK